MGGTATFIGTTFQSRVIAYIYVHILVQQCLGWLGILDDKPLAISGETGGPGDDARVEFGMRLASIEIQAKHGLTAGTKLERTIEDIKTRTPLGNQTKVVLVVDDSSSKSIRTDFAHDLDRIRTGRDDDLKQVTIKILNCFNYDLDLFRRLYIIRLILDNPSDADTKSVINLIKSCLDDPEQAETAWDVLMVDAGELCAKRHTRTKKDLEDLLKLKGIRIKPSTKDAVLNSQLDVTKKMLESQKAYPAFQTILQIKSELSDRQVEPQIRYRLEQQHAAALLQLNRAAEAIIHARKALDVNRDGVQALRTAALAYLQDGDLKSASDFADRAIEVASEDPLNWGVKVQISAASGESLPSPPVTVASSTEYRTALTYIAHKNCEWKEVLDLTTELLKGGTRTPDILFFRARALLLIDQNSIAANEHDRSLDAERLATEILDTVGKDHPLFATTLVSRAEARRRLGYEKKAQEDIDHARTLAPDNPGVIAQSVNEMLEREEAQEALVILRNPAVDPNPILRLLRARALTMIKDMNGASNELNTALDQADSFPQPDMIRLTASEVALCLQNPDLALKILGDVADHKKYPSQITALHARIASAKGAIDEAAKYYRDAVQIDQCHSHEYLTELGILFLKNNRAVDAVHAFDEAGELLPDVVLPHYAHALVKANELVRAKELVNRVTNNKNTPDWALRIATQLALRSDDVEGAIQFLTELVDQKISTVSTRIELIRCLIEIDRIGEVSQRIRQLLTDDHLSPVEKMQVAHLLGSIGQEQEALDLAFDAYRSAPQDPHIHRAFICLMMTLKMGPPTVTEVGPNTHVRLKSTSGEVLEHTIYDGSQIDKLRNELSLGEAETAELIGKKCGDIIIRHEGTFQEKRWEIVEIIPAFIFVLRDSMLHFEDRFPNEPSFMERFAISDEARLNDFIPVISILEEKKKYFSRLVKHYRELIVPLGFISNSLGATIPDLIEEFSGNSEISGPIFVEWSNRQWQLQSISAALGAKEVVLTRSALHTIFFLGLQEQIAARFTLVAPVSLQRELRNELREAEKLFSEGQKAIVSRWPIFTLNELNPADPLLLQRLGRIRHLFDWFQHNVHVETRPLDSIKPLNSEEEMAREVGGRSSYDCVVLAERGRSLYTDDLGLRRMLTTATRSRSFSTFAFLSALVREGIISKEKCYEMQLSLVERNYVFLYPSVSLFELAIRDYQRLGHLGISKVFSLTTAPSINPKEAVYILVQLIKSVATSPVQILSVENVTGLALDVISSRWPKPFCCQLLMRAAEEQFVLLPQHFRTIQQVCKNYAKGGPVTIHGLHGN